MSDYADWAASRCGFNFQERSAGMSMRIGPQMRRLLTHFTVFPALSTGKCFVQPPTLTVRLRSRLMV